MLNNRIVNERARLCSGHLAHSLTRSQTVGQMKKLIYFQLVGERENEVKAQNRGYNVVT